MLEFKSNVRTEASRQDSWPSRWPACWSMEVSQSNTCTCVLDRAGKSFPVLPAKEGRRGRECPRGNMNDEQDEREHQTRKMSQLKNYSSSFRWSSEHKKMFKKSHPQWGFSSAIEYLPGRCEVLSLILGPCRRRRGRGKDKDRERVGEGHPQAQQPWSLMLILQDKPGFYSYISIYF